MCVLIYTGVAVDPCTVAQLIDEPLRSTGYVVQRVDYENLICDRYLSFGWYKFSNGKYVAILER